MRLLFGFIAIFLGGCATIHHNVNDLVHGKKTVKTVTKLQMNYQEAFRKLTPMTRKCLQGAMMGNERRTEEDLDTSKQIATISYINHNAFWGDDYWGYYIFRPLEAKTSELTTYHQVGVVGNADNSKVLLEWLDGRTTCPW